jgi:hypothetical protein
MPAPTLLLTDARLRELERYEAAHHPHRGVLPLAVNRSCWRWDSTNTDNIPDNDAHEAAGTHADPSLGHIAQALELMGGRLGVPRMMLLQPLQPESGGARDACAAARMVREAAATLRRSGRTANSRAFFAVDALPTELRNRVLILVGPGFRGRGGICAAEAYAQLLRLRRELPYATPPPPPPPPPPSDRHNNTDDDDAAAAAHVDRTLAFFEVRPPLLFLL